MNFEIKRLSIQEVQVVLKASENDYDRPLSQLIDIEICSKKWSENAWFLLGIEQKEIASVMAFYKNIQLEKIYVTHFSVSKKYRHQGIGHKMMNKLVDTYSNEYKHIELEAAKDGNAYSFYIREGFEYVEETKDKIRLKRNLV